MRIGITRCYNCICNACTKRMCPYAKSRCHGCYCYDLRKLYDCDFFENRHTVAKRYRIKHRVKLQNNEIAQKLDYIIANLGVTSPKIEKLGTYSVTCESLELFRGSYAESYDFLNRFQREFQKPLKLEKIDFNC